MLIESLVPSESQTQCLWEVNPTGLTIRTSGEMQDFGIQNFMHLYKTLVLKYVTRGSYTDT